jgi:hypothetical protein
VNRYDSRRLADPWIMQPSASVFPVDDSSLTTDGDGWPTNPLWSGSALPLSAICGIIEFMDTNKDEKPLSNTVDGILHHVQ